MNELNLSPFRYERDLNWYFNAGNIPNQNAVFATRDFITQYRQNEISTQDFLNLLFKQKDAIAQFLDSPFDYLSHLQSIPLADTLRHTLYGMLLYWNGGSAEMLLTEEANGQNYQTILRLIQEEFQKQFPIEDTPEKSFCTNGPAQRKIRELRATLNAEMKVVQPMHYPGSHYMMHISIDFEGLPEYVITKGIIHKWEQQRFRKDNEYDEWALGLQKFLNTIPYQYRLLALRKGVEYGQKCYDHHLKHECNSPGNCIYNESWERRLTIAKQALGKADELTAEQNEPQQPEGRNPEFTTARQVLAVHFLLKQCSINPIDKPTEVARFVQFLTGRELGAKRIQDTTLYKNVKSPFSLNEAKTLDDLRYIRAFFEAISLPGIVADIDKEIRQSENG